MLVVTGLTLVGIHREKGKRMQAEEANRNAKIEAVRREKEIADLQNRFKAAENDVDTLLSAVRYRSTEKAERRTLSPDSIGELSSELKKADLLVQSGDFGGALARYKELFSEGWIGESTLSRNLILRRISKLAAAFPAAHSALLEFRDSFVRQIAGGDADRKKAIDVTLLNQYLGDGPSTLALYSTLPDGDPRRQSIAVVGADVFLEAQNYEAILAAKPFGTMLNEFEGNVRRQSETEFVISQAVKNVEVLIGAGFNDEARQLTEKLFRYDSSDQTKALIAERASHARLRSKQ